MQFFLAERVVSCLTFSHHLPREDESRKEVRVPITRSGAVEKQESRQAVKKFPHFGNQSFITVTKARSLPYSESDETSQKLHTVHEYFSQNTCYSSEM